MILITAQFFKGTAKPACRDQAERRNDQAREGPGEGGEGEGEGGRGSVTQSSNPSLGLTEITLPPMLRQV